MRVAIIGSSGSGKSTLARRLSETCGLAHVELDALNWQPGWRNLSVSDPAEFLRRTEAAIKSDRWVVDGNYRAVQPMILRRATDLVWLDYPRRVFMARVIRRSWLRALRKEELWPGTGNREDFRRWLDKEHPIRWAWDTWRERRQRYEALFADPTLAGLAKHRLRRPKEAETLVAQMAAGHPSPPEGEGAPMRGRATRRVERMRLRPSR